MSEKKVVVIAGPSGSGKNSVIAGLKERFPSTASIITCTTRTARPGEQDGVDYFFLSIERFDAQSQAGNIVGKRFVPLFGGIHYGIYVPDLEAKLQNASAVFAPVDIEGAKYLKEKYGALTIFLMPVSFDEYRTRIHQRSPEMSPREFDTRMQIAEREVRIDSAQYDYRVLSPTGQLPAIIDEIVEILKKEGYNL